MLKIENVDTIVGLEYGRYKINSVGDYLESYSFAVLDTDDMRYFRIDLMKKRGLHGSYQLRYSPSKFFNLIDEIVKDKVYLLKDMVDLIIKHRKPLKIKC
jgi:hypothetical protein